MLVVYLDTATLAAAAAQHGMRVTTPAASVLIG
jgi:hypothetical protein